MQPTVCLLPHLQRLRADVSATSHASYPSRQQWEIYERGPRNLFDCAENAAGRPVPVQGVRLIHEINIGLHRGCKSRCTLGPFTSEISRNTCQGIH
jgi:hypothetical protein